MPTMEDPLNKHPDTGISVLIAGGGIGGLFTALESYRNGHQVTVLEARPSNDPAGDFFALGPSGTGCLKNWPLLKRRFDEASLDANYRWSKHTGEHIYGPISMPSSAGVMQIRPVLHKILMEEVRAHGMNLICNAKVVEYFEDERQGGVKLADGSIMVADVVVAADGTHSRSWRLVTGSKAEPKSSGHSLFRTAMPTSLAFESPLVREKFGPHLHEGKDVVWFFLADNTHAICVVGKQTTCWALFHPDVGGSADESWSNLMDPDDAMRLVYDQKNWDPAFLALVHQTPPKSVNDWRLLWRNPQPNSVSPLGRVVQVGDSAHTFLPTSANGGTQAIEDAVSLATCLRLGGGQAVTMALRVHNTLRFERVACAQKSGLMTREKLHKTDWEMVKKNPAIVNAGPGKWIANHDPEQYAIENFDACLKCLQGNTPFLNTNIPPGYTYEPWDITTLMQNAEEGKFTVPEGDWS